MTSTQAVELPEALKALGPDQIEELQDLAELKAWTMSTELEEFNEKEKELAGKAEAEESPRIAKAVRNRIHNKYLWKALRWYLFGGYVDLVGFQEQPKRSYDPDSNPWLKLWVPGWAKTRDEHDASSPYKPLPDKDYLRLFAYAWVHHPLLAVPKSRQMMVTWLFCCIASWMVSFQDAQRIGVISKKEEDADALVERIETVLKGLPRDRFWVPGTAQPKRKTYARLNIHETDSVVMAMSENPDNVRSYTFSWVFDDETAFQDYAEDNIRAILQSVKGGARLTAVSTSNGEDYFHNLISEGGQIPCPAGK